MSAETRIRPARDGEQPRLRAIAVASKSHWGYPAALVERWADADLTPEALASREVLVAEVGGEPVGWASLIPQGQVCVLEDLWIDPDWMGLGIGTELFAHAAEQAAATGAVRMEWESEPNAAGFYAKLGGRYLRDSGPTSFGRMLPVMEVDL